MRKDVHNYLQRHADPLLEPIEWLFFLILPVVFILILSGGTGPAPDQRIHLQVVDQAGSELSQALIEELETSTSVQPFRHH